MLVNSNNQLPEPDEAALAQSHELVQRIRDQILSQQGSIGFQQFMQMALYEPGLGYYGSTSQKFGAQGDFVTAPELSSLFVACLSNQVLEVLDALSGGSVLEIGGGSGVLAAHMLLMLEQKGCLPENYLLLELSASLRARQKETIDRLAPHLQDRVHWLESLPEPGFKGVVIANEVLDAMPVQCFRIQNDQVFDRRVGLDGEGFTWLAESADSALEHQVKKLFPEGMPSGTYDSEWNSWLSPWIAAQAEMLEQGVVLLVDYGYARAEYYHPERVQGTLICHYRHRVHDAPFYLPGLQDITASVDFTAVAEAAVEHDLRVSGYTHQAAFLFGNDLQGEYERLDTDDSRERAKLAHEIRQLTLPGEMGERFKVIALSKKYDQSLRGFAWQDLRAVL